MHSPKMILSYVHLLLMPLLVQPNLSFGNLLPKHLANSSFTNTSRRSLLKVFFPTLMPKCKVANLNSWNTLAQRNDWKVYWVVESFQVNSFAFKGDCKARKVGREDLGNLCAWGKPMVACECCNEPWCHWRLASFSSPALPWKAGPPWSSYKMSSRVQKLI